MTGATLQHVVEFLYLGVIDLNEGNVDEIFSAALFLKILDLENKCIKYYKTILRPNNCLGIWKFADECSPELKKLARDFAYRNFRDVVKCEEFTLLSTEHFQQILESDKLQVDTEGEVFFALISWMAVDEKRRRYFKTMIKTIRLQYVNFTVSSILLVTICIPLDRCFN